jgi:hypothetical protein
VCRLCIILLSVAGSHRCAPGQVCGCSGCVVHLYFCLFISSELMCFLSVKLGIIMIFVVSFVNARTFRPHF